MHVLEDQPFPGSGSNGGISIAVVTGDATLQAKNGEGGWTTVPDGIMSDVVQPFRSPFGIVYRFTNMTGTVLVYS